MEKFAFTTDGKRDGCALNHPFLSLLLISLFFSNSGILARHPKNKDMRRI